MHVLILSAGTGGGHNSAAKAVGEALRLRGATYELVDCLTFLSETTSQVLSRGHNCLYRYFPRLFGWGYQFEENHSARILYESMAPGAKHLYAYIQTHPCDAILCTHLFGSIMVTQARRRFGLSVTDYFVATDYTCYPGVDTVEPSYCFIPHEQLRPQYLEAKQCDERIVASGIPISAAFREPCSKEEARTRLGLPVDGRVVLLTFGSIGCGSLQKLAPDFSAALPEDTKLVIVCGHNEKVYNQLKEIETEQMIPIGFTTQLATYMAAADVGVGKPGGLSTTEMLTVGLPMVMLLAVPGCETHNLAFLEKMKLAVGCYSWEETIAATVALLGDEDRMQDMKKRMLESCYGQGAERIAAFLCEQNDQK